MGHPAGVKRDFVALEERRLRAARLLSKGISQSEVARQVGAHRQSVSRWTRQLEREGRPGLKRAGRAQAAAGGGRPGAHCAGTEARPGAIGLRDETVDGGAGRAPDRARVRGSVSSGSWVEAAAAVGMELPAAHGPGAGTGRGGDPAMETEALAGD